MFEDLMPVAEQIMERELEKYFVTRKGIRQNRDDFKQDAWVTLLESKDGIESASNVEAYMTTAIQNSIKRSGSKEMRFRGKHESLTTELVEELESTEQLAYFDSTGVENVANDEIDQQIVDGRLRGDTPAQIAQSIGKHVSTVYRHENRMIRNVLDSSHSLAT